MGLLRNLAKKVLGKAQPPPRPAGDAVPAPTSEPRPTVGPGGPAATDKPWYLDGSNDGWDTTDVKKE